MRTYFKRALPILLILSLLCGCSLIRVNERPVYRIETAHPFRVRLDPNNDYYIVTWTEEDLMDPNLRAAFNAGELSSVTVGRSAGRPGDDVFPVSGYLYPYSPEMRQALRDALVIVDIIELYLKTDERVAVQVFIERPEVTIYFDPSFAKNRKFHEKIVQVLNEERDLWRKLGSQRSSD